MKSIFSISAQRYLYDVEVNREVLEDLRVLESLFIWRELI